MMHRGSTNKKILMIRSLAYSDEFKEAAEIADEVQWSKIKDVKLLSQISEIYERCKRYRDAKDVLLYAYDRSKENKRIVYKLSELSALANDLDDAQDFYWEFRELAPKDNNNLLLAYYIMCTRGDTDEKKIEVLELFLKGDFDDKWAYTLAELYYKTGQQDKCVKLCDEIILWYSGGDYGKPALSLKHKCLGIVDEDDFNISMSEKKPVKKDESDNILAELEAKEGAKQEKESVLHKPESRIDEAVENISPESDAKNLVQGTVDATAAKKTAKINSEEPGEAVDIAENVITNDADITADSAEEIKTSVIDATEDISGTTSEAAEEISVIASETTEEISGTASEATEYIGETVAEALKEAVVTAGDGEASPEETAKPESVIDNPLEDKPVSETDILTVIAEQMKETAAASESGEKKDDTEPRVKLLGYFDEKNKFTPVDGQRRPTFIYRPEAAKDYAAKDETTDSRKKKKKKDKKPVVKNNERLFKVYLVECSNMKGAVKYAANKLANINTDLGSKNAGAARISDNKFSERGALKTVSVLKGRDLVVDGVTGVNYETVHEVSELIDDGTKAAKIALVDTPTRLALFVNRHKSFAEKCKYIYEDAAITKEEFIGYISSYAFKQSAVLDDTAEDEVDDIAEEMIDDGIPFTISDAALLVDRAVEKAQRPGIKKIFEASRNAEGYLILRSRHFDRG